MTSAGRWGAAVGLLAAGICLVPPLSAAGVPVVAEVAVAASLCGLLFASRRLRGNDFVRSALSVGLMATGTSLIAIPLLLQARNGLGFALAMANVVSNLTSGEEPILRTGPVLALSLAPLVLVPVVAIVLSVVSLRCRVPLTVGLARGFRGVAIPVACMAVFAYAVVVGCEARVETTTSQSLERELAHVGRYYAEQEQTEWPAKPD